MKYFILNEFNELSYLTVEQILFEINRDRSNEWIPYTVEDWRDGLELSGMTIIGDSETKLVGLKTCDC